MKSKLNFTLTWLLLSVLMLFFWILGFMIGNAIFPSSIMEPSEESGGLSELFVVCALNTLAVLILVYNSKVKGLKLAGGLMLMIFGVQFFMSQIETLWFNDSVKFPLQGIWSVVMAGFVMAALFSATAVWVTRNRDIKEQLAEGLPMNRGFVLRIAILSALIYPALYFLAGYFIAWQYETVRLYYASISEQTAFFPIMKENFASGLYYFQIFRGLLWIGIAIPALVISTGSPVQKGLLIGLLFAFLGSTQLLIPNPFMPEDVRLAHFVETITSNFLWGFLIGWVICKSAEVRVSAMG